MRGRKPKSTAQRRLEGNPGKRPLNTEEPQPPTAEPDVFDEPPPELAHDATAAAEWRRCAPMLRQIRQVTDADRPALIAVCVEWSRYVRAIRKIEELGMVVTTKSGYPIPNPYLPIATKALQLCNKLWPELGLTPSSRSRVKKASTDPNAADPYNEFDLPPDLELDDDADLQRH